MSVVDFVVVVVQVIVVVVFLISNFCHVLNVVCFLLGNSPASEFYMLTFRNTLSVPSSQEGRCVWNELVVVVCSCCCCQHHPVLTKIGMGQKTKLNPHSHPPVSNMITHSAVLYFFLCT